MASFTKKPTYAECADKRRPKVDMNLDQDKIKDIGYNFRVLPTFEKSMYEKAFIEYCSFKRNERLNCHWQTYVKNIEARVFAPFQFPNIRDLHIDKHSIRYMPSENHYLQNNRFILKAGPGIDEYGQMPIPHELLYKRDFKTKKGGQKKLKKVS